MAVKIDKNQVFKALETISVPGEGANMVESGVAGGDGMTEVRTDLVGPRFELGQGNDGVELRGALLEGFQGVSLVSWLGHAAVGGNEESQQRSQDRFPIQGTLNLRRKSRQANGFGTWLSTVVSRRGRLRGRG